MQRWMPILCGMIALGLAPAPEPAKFQVWMASFNSHFYKGMNPDLIKQHGADVTSCLAPHQKELISLLKNARPYPANHFSKFATRLRVEDGKETYVMDRLGGVWHRGGYGMLSEDDYLSVLVLLVSHVPTVGDFNEVLESRRSVVPTPKGALP